MCFTPLTVCWFGMWESSFISFSVLPLAVAYNTQCQKRDHTQGTWTIVCYSGWIDSLNVNIVFNYIDSCVYDCSMPLSPSAGVLLSEIEKMKSWPCVVMQGVLEAEWGSKVSHHTRSEEWSVLVSPSWSQQWYEKHFGPVRLGTAPVPSIML